MKHIKIQFAILLGLLILNSTKLLAQGCATGVPWCTGTNPITTTDYLGGDGSTSNSLNIQTNGTTRVTVAGNSNNVGIGTTTPSAMLSLDGNAARTIQMERHTTAASAGNNLTLLAGGAKSGGKNLNGGDLLLNSGTSTGTGG